MLTGYSLLSYRRSILLLPHPRRPFRSVLSIPSEIISHTNPLLEVPKVSRLSPSIAPSSIARLQQGAGMSFDRPSFRSHGLIFCPCFLLVA
jgi:hypothetical protein